MMQHVILSGCSGGGKSTLMVLIGRRCTASVRFEPIVNDAAKFLNVGFSKYACTKTVGYSETEKAT